MAVLPLPLFPRTSKCSLERSCYFRISRRAGVSAPPPVCSSKHNTQLLLSFMSSHPSVLSLLFWVTDMHAQRDTHTCPSFLHLQSSHTHIPSPMCHVYISQTQHTQQIPCLPTASLGILSWKWDETQKLPLA